jgi:hypothetical protein
VNLSQKKLIIYQERSLDAFALILMVCEVPQSKRKTQLWSEQIKPSPKWSKKVRKSTSTR